MPRQGHTLLPPPPNIRVFLTGRAGGCCGAGRPGRPGAREASQRGGGEGA
eukprot:COSAG06_NODE_31454_length_521_cov_1.037915_1_plen_49_part_10